MCWLHDPTASISGGFFVWWNVFFPDLRWCALWAHATQRLKRAYLEVSRNVRQVSRFPRWFTRNRPQITMPYKFGYSIAVFIKTSDVPSASGRLIFPNPANGRRVTQKEIPGQIADNAILAVCYQPCNRSNRYKFFWFWFQRLSICVLKPPYYGHLPAEDYTTIKVLDDVILAVSRFPCEL